MANEPPTKDFGKRRPASAPSASREPVKRSGHVALLVMGTIAVGATAYTLMPRRNCDPLRPGASVPGASVPGASVPGATVPGASVPGAAAPVQTSIACSSSSSGGSSHWSSRSSFYGGDSASHSSSGGSSGTGSGGVTRGGFGSFAHGFSGGG